MRFHFETEEELMRRCGYDCAEQREADAHLQEHREFFKQLADLCAQWDAIDAASGDAKARLPKQWLSKHIRTSDRRVGRFITWRKSA